MGGWLSKSARAERKQAAAQQEASKDTNNAPVSGCPFAAIIKATTPVVAPKTREIVDDFYPRMFRQNPETKAFFNQANQFAEPPMQRLALANAVVAYASNVDTLANVSGAVNLIAHKHCGLGVEPEHYGIVHKNLMESIGHVLGDVVTPEIGQAWSDAVLALAKIMYETETDLYDMAQKRSGGWKGKREFKISAVKSVTSDCKEFTFEPVDGSTAPIDFTPGQFLTLHLTKHSAEATPRHYTVTNAPGKPFLQCCIKKIEKGFISNLMHGLKEGDVVELSPPFGVFNLKPENKCVLISAGIGATPMKCFLDAAKDNVELLVHVDKNADAHPFLDHVKASGVSTEIMYTSERPRPSGADVAELVKQKGLTHCDCYLCGPPPFLTSVKASLLEAGVQNVFIDVFGPELSVA